MSEVLTAVAVSAVVIVMSLLVRHYMAQSRAVFDRWMEGRRCRGEEV